MPDKSFTDPESRGTSTDLKAWINRLIAGKAPSDPLYLSNRRLRDRLWPYIAAGTFFLVLLVGWKVAVPHSEPPAHALPSNAKLAAMSFPRFADSQLEVVGVGVLADGSKLEGEVRNKTGHVIALGRLSFELQDANGHFTGATGMELKQIQPGQITKFELPISQPESRVALVTGISVE